MQLDALFELADQARNDMCPESGVAWLGDGSGEPGGAHSTNGVDQAEKITYTVDAKGDVHVCFGSKCQYAVLGHENQYICSASGRVVAIEHQAESDPSWTGRSSGSANPDDLSGTPAGGWVKRRDMYAASVAAYRFAHQISDAEIKALPKAPSATPPVAKRGALCVDESPDDNALPKKARSSRKGNWTRESIDKLASEAITVINKLFIATPKRPTETPLPDPRLQNLEFVKALAVRKYIKRCADGESSLNLDVLENVIIHANEFVREQRAAATARLNAAAHSAAASKHNRTTAVFSGQIRNQLSQLIVSLWRASCLTKYFLSSKKGSDSFRPFAAGILYSLKRGLYLTDGTCVVPVLEELSVHLPALRSASSTPAAKQLQSSSHRGICSIQKALASISDMNEQEAMPARTLLRDASRQGAFLRELVSRNS